MIIIEDCFHVAIADDASAVHRIRDFINDNMDTFMTQYRQGVPKVEGVALIMGPNTWHPQNAYEAEHMYFGFFKPQFKYQIQTLLDAQ